MINAFKQVAPLYNLILVVIVLYLFARLFKAPAFEKVYLTPWKLILASLLVYVKIPSTKCPGGALFTRRSINSGSGKVFLDELLTISLGRLAGYEHYLNWL